MATPEDLRHQMVRHAVLYKPDAVVDVSIDLWQRLASELTSIIGDGGFQSLYTRSLHLARATFPWMELSPAMLTRDGRFTALKTCLAGQDVASACEASISLLNIFIDILIVLIGELLTTSILRSAWGNEVMDMARKELK